MTCCSAQGWTWFTRIAHPVLANVCSATDLHHQNCMLEFLDMKKPFGARAWGIRAACMPVTCLLWRVCAAVIQGSYFSALLLPGVLCYLACIRKFAWCKS